MRRLALLISFVAIIYVGCAGKEPPLAPPATEPAPAPAPRPGRPLPDRPEPLDGIELHDEVLALAVTRDRPARLAILARRTFFLYELRPGGLVGLGDADLAPRVPAGARLARRAVGYLRAGGTRALTEPDRFYLWSTALGAEGGAAYQLGPDGLTPLILPRTLAPPPVLEEGQRQGWRGRAVELGDAEDGPILVHVGEGGKLIGSPWFGMPIDLGGSAGEPLVAVPGTGGGASILVSSPSLPGEPDRVIEYEWDGSRLRERRVSRDFDGRLAALALLEGGRRVAVAEVDRPGHSRVHLLEASAFWLGGSR